MDANELSARLPPSRDDEPPSLRQDILDELADHLACAKHREMLTTNDEAKAEQRVLDKFGDPREVARKLWFQAMWSRIMSQRWLLSGTGVLVAICLCLTGTVLWQMQHQRAAMAEQQRLIAETLAQMARLSEAKANESPQPPPAPTPSSIKVKLAFDKPDSPPAVGFLVSLKRLGVDNQFGPEVLSDDQGMVDFGYFEPAKYAIVVSTNSRDRKLETQFTLPLSTAHIEQVTCPASVPISWAVDLPEDLEKQNVQALLKCNRVPEDSGPQWPYEKEVVPYPYSNGDDTEYTSLVLIKGGQGWEKGGGSEITSRLEAPPGSEAVSTGFASFIVSFLPGQRQQSGTEYVGVRFKEIQLTLVVPAAARNPQRLPRPLPKGEFGLSVSYALGALKRFTPIAPVPDKASEKQTERGSGSMPSRFIRNVERFPLKNEFVVSADKPNQWMIQVPDELIEQARAYLKEHPVATSDEPAK